MIRIELNRKLFHNLNRHDNPAFYIFHFPNWNISKILNIFTPRGKTLHILGDKKNKSCDKSRVLVLFTCIGILVGQQASSTAAVGSLDFADNSLSGEKKETSIFRFLFRINNNKTTSTEILSTINWVDSESEPLALTMG